MKKQKKTKPRSRTFFRWFLWALLLQFILINISAALYAYNFTHLHSPEQNAIDLKKPVSKNIFAKTWRFFRGSQFYKLPQTGIPLFPYSTILLETKSKIAIEAWYIPVDSNSRGTIILFHGLSGNKSMVLEQAYEFLNWKFNVLLVDVRDHGNSGGSVTTIGYNETEEVKLAYNYVQQQGEKNIYLWGASMGAVEVIKAIGDYELKPAGIIVAMPFRSLYSHVRGRLKTMGFFRKPFALLITFWIGAEHGFNGFGFNTRKYAKKVQCPVLIQYGARDPIVADSEANDIYKAFSSEQKELVIYEDAFHELFLKRHPGKWKKEVNEFLSVTGR